MNNQYINLLDMFDGGGAGRSGDTFQGGGLLSALGNTMMRPAGYQNRMLNNKNGTGRAVMSAVNEITGRTPDGSVRPQRRNADVPDNFYNNPRGEMNGMSSIETLNLPVDPAMAAPMQDANSDLVGLDADAMNFQNFLQDLRLKERKLGLPPMPLADVELMFEQVRDQRILQEMGVTGAGYSTMSSPTLPRQTPALPVPSY